MESGTLLNIKQAGLRTIRLEAEAISAMQHLIDDDFERAVKTISECTGRLVISGIGKSAIIAQKIVATLNSTGTPSIFLHAADAIHGERANEFGCGQTIQGQVTPRPRQAFRRI